MKRFVFTLKAVYDIAVSNEKQQKNLLRKIEERIRSLYGKLDAMLLELADSRARCATDVDAGTDALRLSQYARYFESREELIAELGASMLCNLCGIESQIENAASYIANWKRFIANDERAILTAASKAEAAVNFILNKAKKGTEEEETEEDK